MSTLQRVNFEPVSDIMPVQRKDFALADKTLADPFGANPLVDGEWMIINSSYQAVEAADRSAADNAATQASYVVWAEKGRWDVQAMSGTKVPLLWLGEFEADTRIFDAAAVVGGNGAAITTVGQPLKVATVTLGSLVKVGLVGMGASDTAPIVGRVTRLPANNGGKLRFRTATSR